ncbi:TPA: hypothetical protein N0F65_007269 [Lagenidium giganteum]|uniref:Uncharacterized protein n=1 Tax=Lagenidium giganteum TaxID=4803 RepID=A0AAV2YXM2_9STRA|nr:TPA: hypothetical protein N0F65_007269 [Lagenidium giganteum]
MDRLLQLRYSLSARRTLYDASANGIWPVSSLRALVATWRHGSKRIPGERAMIKVSSHNASESCHVICAGSNGRSLTHWALGSERSIDS